MGKHGYGHADRGKLRECCHIVVAASISSLRLSTSAAIRESLKARNKTPSLNSAPAKQNSSSSAFCCGAGVEIVPTHWFSGLPDSSRPRQGHAIRPVWRGLVVSTTMRGEASFLSPKLMLRAKAETHLQSSKCWNWQLQATSDLASGHAIEAKVKVSIDARNTGGQFFSVG